MPATLKSRLDAPRAAETTPEKQGGFPRLTATLKSRLDAPWGRQNDSEEARRVSAVAGNSQKSLQRPPGPPKRLQRSEKVLRSSRHLSKAVSTPPGAAETAPEKREGFPRLPATLKSRLNAPRDRVNDSEEARRFPAVAGTSQKPPLNPPEPPKQLRRSEKIFRRSRHLSKAASTSPGTEETAPKKRK